MHHAQERRADAHLSVYSTLAQLLLKSTHLVDSPTCPPSPTKLAGEPADRIGVPSGKPTEVVSRMKMSATERYNSRGRCATSRCTCVITLEHTLSKSKRDSVSNTLGRVRTRHQNGRSGRAS